MVGMDERVCGWGPGRRRMAAPGVVVAADLCAESAADRAGIAAGTAHSGEQGRRGGAGPGLAWRSAGHDQLCCDHLRSLVRAGAGLAQSTGGSAARVWRPAAGGVRVVPGGACECDDATVAISYSALPDGESAYVSVVQRAVWRNVCDSVLCDPGAALPAGEGRCGLSAADCNDVLFLRACGRGGGEGWRAPAAGGRRRMRGCGFLFARGIFECGWILAKPAAGGAVYG